MIPPVRRTGTRRFIQLPGVYNFRDVGGYRTTAGRQVRRQRLYRSGEFHRIDPSGVRVLQEELGLNTIIDLRWTEDLDRAGTLGPLAEAAIDRHHIPLGNAESLADIPPLPVGLAYLPLAERCGADVVRVAQTLTSSDGLPAVIHCSAGKDRTGIVIALLLALLGIEDDDIVNDYSLTASEMPRWIAYLIERGELPPEPTGEPHSGDEVAPDAIRSMLESLRSTHGSIEGYFLHQGLTENEIGRLHNALLE